MVRERMAKVDCVGCIHSVVCMYRSRNEQPWIKEHCKLAARDEQPHGEWIFEEWVGYHIPDTGDVVCSECKIALFEGVSKRKFDVLSYNFCPNCGASMKKEGE